MKEIMSCRVIGYLYGAVRVRLANGEVGILRADEISDVKIPVEEKVYIGQTLYVAITRTCNGLVLEHKRLLENKESYLQEHLGDIVKARVVFSTYAGCMVELASNVHCFVHGMCNLKNGILVWVSIKMNGKAVIDSVLYDEDRIHYPEYKYVGIETLAEVQTDISVAA